TVQAAETGFTDSAWQVTGTITVTNPNDWESIVVNDADAVDNGGSCTVNGGTSVTVLAAKSASGTDVCTVASGASGENTATATWDAAAAFTPDGSASGQASFAFTTPTTRVNQTITVTDTFNNVTTTLGTLTATDGQPYASKTYTYSRTISVPQFGCVSYTN